jgi:CubicO group peptidase (beta-lactamase class C family)
MTDWHDFDVHAQEAMRSWHCPGVAIAIVRGDDVVHRAAHGLRDVERALEITPETRFPMASVTKSVSAMSVAVLVDEGKLAWDTPVRTYLPEFVLHDAYASEHLTLRDMLSHRSGLPRHDLAAWRLELPRAEFVKRLRHLRFSASFRERFQYNNLMYYASAHVVERVAGTRWEDFVSERIFEPLGMVASNFDPQPPRAGQVNALGYRVDRDDAGEARGLIAVPFGAHTELSPGAAGALFSSLEDMIRWLGVNANGGRWGDVRLVSPESCAQLHLPVTVIPGGGPWGEMMGNTLFAYALGWSVEPYRGHTLVQHGGNVEGHSLAVGFVPRERVGVIVLTNGAMMPLRDVLLYDALDRALGLEARNWNARMHGLYDEMFRGVASGKTTARTERRADAPASHALGDYAGRYQADGYPDLEVRPEGEALQARLVGSLDWAALRHVHFDVFEWDLSDLLDQLMRVRFQVDEHGDVDAVAVPIEPEVDDVRFRRKRMVLDPEIVTEVQGRFDTAIEGLSFSVSASDEKLFVTQSGGTPEELEPVSLTEDVVRLRHKRTRFEFQRSGARSERLTIKVPGMTLQAVRKP